MRWWRLPALLLALLAIAPARAEPAGHFLVVSDIHFDPMTEPRLVDRLAAAAPDEWRAILDGAEDQGLGRYGLDTSWPLLRSGLQAMHEALPHPAFILDTGDVLAHHFRRSFDAAASRHDDAAYRAFVANTMRFVALQFQQSFPGTPVFLALGNNDAGCGDYRLQPNGPFLADALATVRDLAGGAAAPGLARDWAAYGNYDVAVPKATPLRLLLLDDIFFSPHYRNACGKPAGGDPAQATLDWLEAELKEAKAAGERVWLALHIPPGIDPYSTLQRGACPGPIVTMWTEAAAATFEALLRRYRDTVAAVFAGHTHMDDFRLLGDGGFVLITPAVSPIFGQNPGFRTVAYDSDGRLLDATTWGLTNLAEADGKTPPVWRGEYSFAAAWHLPALDRASFAELDGAIAASPEARARWQKFYAVSSPLFWPLNAAIGADKAIRAYRCAEEYEGVADFRRCYCTE